MALVVMASLLVGMAGVMPVTARAATPEETAAKLHNQAKRAYRGNNKAQAVELWREALKAHAFWKYAYNLANAAYETKLRKDAWDAIEKTRELGMPDQYESQLRELRAKIRTDLMRDHARIQLSVTPRDAKVTRNNQPWKAPRALWTTDAESRIVVTLKGYKAVDMVWKHAIGAEGTRTIALEKIVTGNLTIRGTPEQASVKVNGVKRGTLPIVGPLAIKPGSYEVLVEREGYIALSTTVKVSLGKEHSVDVSLLEKPKPPPPKAPPPDLATPGWITLATGIVLAAGGGGLLAWSGATFDELAAINTDPAKLAAYASYEDYRKEHGDLADRFETTRGAGYGLIGVGAAAVIAGIVLVALDESDVPEDSKKVDVGLHVGADGFGARAGWRF